MGKIIQTIALVLMIVLFIPAGLITISGNAVPGDLTYPLKRKLEDAVLFLASFNSYSKAYFAVAQSNRRYEETELLLKAGTDSSKSLDELVTQTTQAADNIDRIRNSGNRARLFADLSDSIERYDQGLAQAQQQIVRTPVDTQPSKLAEPSYVPNPSISSNPASSKPAASVKPPSQIAKTNITKSEEDANKQSDAIEKARRELEELKRRLEEEKRRLKEEADLEATRNRPSPSPSPSPIEAGRSSTNPEPSVRTPGLSGPDREREEREREEREKEERERGSGNGQGHGNER